MSANARLFCKASKRGNSVPQIGFAVACFAELLLPHGGLFSSFSGSNLELFSSLALLAVAMSAGVATLSKPRIGSQLKEVGRWHLVRPGGVTRRRKLVGHDTPMPWSRCHTGIIAH